MMISQKGPQESQSETERSNSQIEEYPSIEIDIGEMENDSGSEDMSSEKYKRSSNIEAAREAPKKQQEEIERQKREIEAIRKKTEEYKAEAERKRIDFTDKKREYEKSITKLRTATASAKEELNNMSWWNRTMKTAKYIEALGKFENAEARQEKREEEWRVVQGQFRTYEKTKELPLAEKEAPTALWSQKIPEDNEELEVVVGKPIDSEQDKHVSQNGSQRNPKEANAPVNDRIIPKKYKDTIEKVAKMKDPMARSIKRLDEIELENPYSIREQYPAKTLVQMWKEFNLPYPIRLYGERDKPETNIARNDVAKEEWRKRQQENPEQTLQGVIGEMITFHDFVGGIQERQMRIMNEAVDIVNRYYLTTRLLESGKSSKKDMEAILQSLDKEAVELKERAFVFYKKVNKFLEENEALAKRVQEEAA